MDGHFLFQCRRQMARRDTDEEGEEGRLIFSLVGWIPTRGFVVDQSQPKP
jgi:hypothetical protein